MQNGDSFADPDMEFSFDNEAGTLNARTFQQDNLNRFELPMMSWDNMSRCMERLETLKAQLETAKVEAVKEFPKEQELSEKTARLGELNALLDMDKKENIVLDCELDEEETEPERGGKDRER